MLDLNTSVFHPGPVHTDKIDPFSFDAVQEYLRKEGFIAKPHRAVEKL